jgi:acetyl-CoA hydrolase
VDSLVLDTQSTIDDQRKRIGPKLIFDRKVPTALADHVERHGLQGKLKYNLFVGASSGAETENRWARNNMIERRAPHQVGKDIAKGINEGRIKFFDKHLSMFPVDLMYGYYTMNRKSPHETGQGDGMYDA